MRGGLFVTEHCLSAIRMVLSKSTDEEILKQKKGTAHAALLCVFEEHKTKFFAWLETTMDTKACRRLSVLSQQVHDAAKCGRNGRVTNALAAGYNPALFAILPEVAKALAAGGAGNERIFYFFFL